MKENLNKNNLFFKKIDQKDYPSHQPLGLYDSSYEHDACGVGMLVNINGDKSHELVDAALTVLENMKHRGAEGADNKTGDGAGIMIQIPHEFILLQGIPVPEKGKYGTGLVFLPKDEKRQAAIMGIVIEEVEREGLQLMHMRNVPVRSEILGKDARETEPDIKQIFITGVTDTDTFERTLYLVRKRIERRIDDKDFYIVSLSSKNIIYKGMLSSTQVREYFKDLTQPYFTSGLALVHSRFSTNTFPTWSLAQPFRLLAHNGEINTIRGNRAWMEARESVLSTPALGNVKDIRPIIQPGMSDSASLDNVLEFFVMSGLSLPHAMAMLVPESFNDKNPISEDLKAFYEYHSILMEPWDGPAALLFSDGRYAGGMLDRNGLRPARYVITKDKLITCASEVGIWDYQPDEVVEKGRVGPGELMVIDTRSGRILHSAETDDDLKSRHPYKEWMEKNVRRLVPFEDLPDEEVGSRELDDDTLASYQKQFNYSAEELDSVIRVLGENGQEAVGSMGDDTPFAVLSSQPRIIYDYFRQQFAQVTNPPIDPLREAHVMSLATSIGREMNVFCEAEGQAHRLSFKSPILLYSDFKQLTTMKEEHYRADTLDITFDVTKTTLEATVKELCDKAEKMVRSGTVLLVLSDRNIAKDRLPVPAPMAVGAIQTRLVDQSLRCDANIIVETASARDPHHFAVLLGFGATAIYPYLAYETLGRLVDTHAIAKDYRTVMLNYRNGINKGLYKIMSKMGISTIASYRCSKLFEAVGLHDDVVGLCFQGAVSRIGGASFEDFQQDLLNLSKRAWLARKPISQGGLLKYVHGGEYHAYNPDVVRTLQQAVQSGEYSDYQEYAKLVNERPATTLRDLLAITPGENAVNIACART